MIRAQMLEQVVFARKPVTTFPCAVRHRTVLEYGVVHAGLMAFEVCGASKCFSAVCAGEGFIGSVDR